MIAFLIRRFIKDPQNVTSPAVRQQYGTLCGIVGIILNFFLFGIKLLAGTISGSVAVTADAFNNLSDAGSSVVTLIGFRLSGQKPDPHHPFGHGRLEYISGFVVSMIILLMGFELGKTSVMKIIHPEEVTFHPLTVIILAVSIGIKLYIAAYNRSYGKKIDSAAMSAVAIDSLSDCVSTTVVLIATLVSHFFSIQIDGWCGAAVALFILYSGIRSVGETLNPLLGTPPEEEFVNRVRDLVLSYDAVKGVHDLIVHNYGPGRTMITLHAEVPEDADLRFTHDTIDNIEQHLFVELGCEAVIHMDPIATNDALTSDTRAKMSELVRAIDKSVTIHDFRMVVGDTHTNLIFDICVPFKFRLSDDEIVEEVSRLARVLDDSYRVVAKVDKSYTL